MIEIPLTQGKVALIDDVDARLAEFRWCAVKIKGGFYAVRWAGKKRVYLHRAVINPRDGLEVDHRDGNGLDCRRRNLREATHAQNLRNRKRDSTNTSGFKGVSWHRQMKKWGAYIQTGGRTRYLGLFSTREDAARAYDVAAVTLFGEFARINFPKTQGVA